MAETSMWTRRWLAVGSVFALTTVVACSSDGDRGTNPPPARTGSLTVRIGGLPGATPAAVTVTGPSGFTRSLTSTETIASLTPGAYTVTGAAVTTADGRYGVTPGSQTVNVVAGDTPVVAVVTYALATGGLTVNIVGLASGTEARVTVTGPGFTRTLTATQTIPVLEPGTYTITAAEVTTADARYSGLPPTQSIAVTAGLVTATTVTYAASTGRLTISIVGLPQGSNAAVTVTGPGGFSRTVTANTTLTLLAPGTYTVTGGDVQAGNFTFRGTAPASQAVVVPASTTPAAVTVRYQAIDGALSITLAGLPGGVDGNVTITGPGGFATVVRNSHTQARLTPGTYTLTAAVVSVGSGFYAASPDVQLVIVTAGATAGVTVNYAPSVALKLQPVTSGLSRPLQLIAPPNDNTRLFIVEQTGLIRILQNGQLLAAPFLDLSTRIFLPQSGDDERGALGMAFHPAYGLNGQFFVYYIDIGGSIVVDRFQVSGNPDVALPNGTPVLTLPKGDPFHNGGAIAFGADGLLYIGIGDGACCNDPGNNGQSTNTLFGKILRLDINAPPYAIPQTNPFFGQPGRRGEIWAYGLRNPWRIDPDPTSGLLYIADVGESAFEEVNVMTQQGGANFGWNRMEGPQCRLPGCSQTGLTLPLLSYSHAEGCSITGGYVYRGTLLPELMGHYFYSDFCRGFLRSFKLVNGIATERRDWAVASPGSVTSFGKDANGELYVLTLAGGVFRIVRQ